MKIKTLAIIAAIALSGCASQDYQLYAENNAKIEIAKANAEAERYKALGAIASGNDTAAKVGATVALAISGNNGGAKDQSQLQAPQANQALQWASILVPSVTQLYGISANMRVAMTQSDNAAKVATSTNDAFVGIAGKIQAPAPNVTTTNTLSGSGTMGAGSYTTNANQANQTLSGTGTLGSGAYSTTDNHSTVDNHTTNPAVVVPQVTTTSTSTTTNTTAPAAVCTWNATTSVMTCI